MDRQAIPDQNDLPLQMAEQVPEEENDFVGTNAPGESAEIDRTQRDATDNG